MGAPTDGSGSELTPGQALAGTQSGALPIGTVKAILEKAPADIQEKTIDVPEWECSVKIRSFTAAQSSGIRQRGLAFQGEETKVAWGEMEIMQFQQGVVEPRFDEDQVRQLHLTSGRGFSRVIEALDELSNIDKEALAKAREEFPKSEEPAQV
jgi:hypothetical protein